MRIQKFILFFFVIVVYCSITAYHTTPPYFTYEYNPKKEVCKLYWKNSKGEKLKSLGAVKNFVASQNHTLLIAMNAGMYLPDNTPQGLFLSEGATIKKLDTKKGKDNFYWLPNGVFALDKTGKPFVVETSKYNTLKNMWYATQSGPMLVINGKMHEGFSETSKSLYRRNGVGILPNGNAVFIMSKDAVTLHEFATMFMRYGCKNALYLDGAISQMYCPSQNISQLGGDFGVMVGIEKK
jgi:uncharacterized protein YigE (DUF2233 family)